MGRRRQPPEDDDTLALSFLDLLSSAMGAAFLLFIIFSAVRVEDSQSGAPAGGNFILATWTIDDASADLRLFVRGPNGRGAAMPDDAWQWRGRMGVAKETAPGFGGNLGPGGYAQIFESSASHDANAAPAPDVGGEKVGLRSPTSGDIPYGGQKTYVVSLDAAVWYRITIDGEGAAPLSDPYLYVYPPGGAPVAESDDHTNEYDESDLDVLYEFQPEVSGEYRLAVTPYLSGRGGSFRLEVAPLDEMVVLPAEETSGGRRSFSVLIVDPLPGCWQLAAIYVSSGDDLSDPRAAAVSVQMEGDAVTAAAVAPRSVGGVGPGERLYVGQDGANETCDPSQRSIAVPPS